MCQGIAQKVQTLCHEYWHGILHKALNLYREDIINSKSSSLQMHKHHTLLCLSCMVKLVIVLCLQIPTIFPWWSHLAQVQGPGLPPCVLWGALWCFLVERVTTRGEVTPFAIVVLSCWRWVFEVGTTLTTDPEAVRCDSSSGDVSAISTKVPTSLYQSVDIMHTYEPYPFSHKGTALGPYW